MSLVSVVARSAQHCKNLLSNIALCTGLRNSSCRWTDRQTSSLYHHRNTWIEENAREKLWKVSSTCLCDILFLPFICSRATKQSPFVTHVKFDSLQTSQWHFNDEDNDSFADRVLICSTLVTLVEAEKQFFYLTKMRKLLKSATCSDIEHKPKAYEYQAEDFLIFSHSFVSH